MDSFLFNVAMPLPVRGLFTYSVPGHLEDQIKTGVRVLVPFGQRVLSAYAIDCTASPPDYPIKPIIDILDDVPLFGQTMIPFFNWIADYYFYPIGQVIKHALPSGLNIHDRPGLCLTAAGQAALAAGAPSDQEMPLLEVLARHAPRAYSLSVDDSSKISARLVAALIQKGWIEKSRRLIPPKTTARMISKISLPTSNAEKIPGTPSRQKIIEYLKAQGSVDLTRLKELGGNATALARKMARDGQVEIYQERFFRDPFGDPILPDEPPRLTPEQLVAIARVKSTLGRQYQTYLLAGVTGSGKTEIYLQLTDLTISQGLTALILVPEIALISQTERRFRARFGNRVAVLHSSLSSGQRLDQWEQMAAGKIHICIGVRSAIFAPLEKIGLIIVDEEHDDSYKQDDRLRYNARDLAVLRGRQINANVVLGSATPSIQSCYNVTAGKFIEIPLHQRVAKRPLPQIEIVDLAKDKEITGTRRFITPILYQAMQATLAKGEQVLLFLNRRGFANFPICTECGEAVKCKNCDVSMTLHKSINGLKCHFCGFTCAATTNCTICGSSKIRYLGMGTEKIEETVKRLFPEVNVARMDRDTTSRKGALLKILKGLKQGDIQILVGTQMVAKGHDFPNITLVGIICADLSLSFPDFRAGERTFQILAQVAGRSGRGASPGRVILQSFQPEHFSITSAQSQDFRKFYTHEIPFRKALNYPPFSRLIQIRIVGQDKDEAATQARKLADACHILKNNATPFKKTIEILGPIEAPLFRVAKFYRYQMILKCSSSNLLHRFMARLLTETHKIKKKTKTRIDIDVDPHFML